MSVTASKAPAPIREIVTAVIVTRPGAAPPTVDDLRAFCDGRLAGFKQPRRVALVDALPRTAATGQIQRTLIVEQLQQHVAKDSI